jgi:hypothetical protein
MRILGLLFVSAGMVWAAAPKPIASYRIQSELDAKLHRITGSETVKWVNDSPDTVPTLQMHLYMNAFKNEKSTFTRESGGQLRGDEHDKKDWGWVDVRRFMLMDGTDLTRQIRFIQPDDGNKDDQTVIEIPLPRPVKPGETLEFSVQFVTQLPQVFARTGFHGDFHLVGQWFPKLGVWETKGFRRREIAGWNCHQFHANSEFFANFGNYSVDITLPSDYVIGATGQQVSKKTDAKAKKTTYRFEQENVTDFAWTAQKNYLRLERMFVASKETTPEEVRNVAKLHGISEDEARLSDVTMIALVQPEHAEQAQRHIDALRAALKWFGLWYGRYPYKTITVVDPPRGAGGSGGMEYPTFITAGTYWRAPEDVVLGLEMVTVHEFGHQFWMQLVATNEFEEAWMDEGFNSYSTAHVMEKAYPPSNIPVEPFGLRIANWLGLPKIHAWSMERGTYLPGPAKDDMDRKAWQYLNGNSYGLNSYAKPATLLRNLEEMLGKETMARVMRTYHQRWRYAHPTSRDFVDVLNEVSGKDWNWFFGQYVYGNRLLDYRVDWVNSREIETSLGVYDAAAGKKTTVTQEDADKADEKNKKKQYECTVRVFRYGDGTAPVEVTIHFKDGSVERREWDGEYRWAKFKLMKPSEVDWVQIDPARKHWLDVNWINNSWQKRYQKEAMTRWGGNLLFAAQNLFLWLSAVV